MSKVDYSKFQVEHPKLLQVYAAVVSYGPIALDNIFPLVQRSRSATYRALKELQKSGWVRQTLSGHQYVATSIIDDLSANGSISMPELDLLCMLLNGYQSNFKLQIRIGFYLTLSSFNIVECSESKVQSNLSLRPDQDNLSCIAFSILPRLRQQKIFKNLYSSIDLTTQDELRAQAEFNRKTIMSNGYVIEEPQSIAYFGLRTPSRLYGALSIVEKSPLSQSNIATHALALSKILLKHSLIFPTSSG